MHITKVNNYSMDEMKKGNTPIRKTCLPNLLSKIYKVKLLP